MNTGIICGSVLAGSLLGAAPAYPDFQSALGEYNAGRYDEAFAAAAIEAWLNASFTPASRHGQPVESRLQTGQVFSVDGVTVANSAYFKKARPAADNGDRSAEYLVGIATLDSALGASYAKAGQFLLDSARDGDADAQYWVGRELRQAVAAASCAANGDFHTAVEQQELATAKARSLGWNTHAMGERLAAYRGGKSWAGNLFAP
jgi:hypothetical protein